MPCTSQARAPADQHVEDRERDRDAGVAVEHEVEVRVRRIVVILLVAVEAVLAEQDGAEGGGAAGRAAPRGSTRSRTRAARASSVGLQARDVEVGVLDLRQHDHRVLEIDLGPAEALGERRGVLARQDVALGRARPQSAARVVGRERLAERREERLRPARRAVRGRPRRPRGSRRREGRRALPAPWRSWDGRSYSPGRNPRGGSDRIGARWPSDQDSCETAVRSAERLGGLSAPRCARGPAPDRSRGRPRPG